MLPLGSLCHEEEPPVAEGCLGDVEDFEKEDAPHMILLQSRAEVPLTNSAKKEPEPGTERTRTTLAGSPCECVAWDAAWRRADRSEPMSVFIDLGAADGNSFHKFYDTEMFVNRSDPKWRAFLVEANGAFTDALQNLSQSLPGQIYPVIGRAAYSCNARVPFYMDHNADHNYWGSNIGGGDKSINDWKDKWNMTKVYEREQKDLAMTSIETFNFVQFLYENTIPGDRVTVKMDIEGAEWDILPCLARSLPGALPAQLFVEVHPASWQLGMTTPEELNNTLDLLQSLGVYMPHYNSMT